MLKELSKKERNWKKSEMMRWKSVLWYTAEKELPKSKREIAVKESINANGMKRTAEEESSKIIEK